MRHVYAPVHLVLGLLAVAGAVITWLVLFGPDPSLEGGLFGHYYYDPYGRYPGTRIPLTPDRFALLCLLAGGLAWVVMAFVPRKPRAAKVASRVLLLGGVLGMAPVVVRLFAVGMGVFSFVLFGAFVLGLLYMVGRWVFGRD